MSVYFGGSGVAPGLKGLPSTNISLNASEVWPIQPAGWYSIHTGPYITVQEYDPITTTWRSIGGTGSGEGNRGYYYSDGVNYRLANMTGCAVGALITNAGSGYTSAPVVTASAGSSTWQAIVGGAINTTITVTNGGQGYTLPPIVLIASPPSPGIPATAYATLTGSAVTSITVVNQGAGYASAPTVVLLNDPRDTTGYGASATTTLTGAGTITGLLATSHGTGAQTSVPTLSFAGGGGSSAAATAIMCWTITAYTVSNGGAGLAGANAWVTAEDKFPTTAAAYTNPSSQSDLVKIRKADIKGPITANAITATGAVIYDGGIYTAAPEPLVLANASIVTTAPVLTLTMGGAAGTASILPM